MAEQEVGIQVIANRTYIGKAKTGDNIDAVRSASYGWDGLNWQRTPSTSVAKKIDTTTAPGIIYIGVAIIGSATSASVWAIKKIDTTNGADVTWANGDSTSTNIWDNRTSLSYL